ncbi:SusC/RagA family TonB-linked outer membrane protein [Mucilaginibacter boryungensis]|uniref:SusC/RagA family TonB-linked outer membrane protein n=2 Tax=Mucilaginibacter boryungensis TaxID=768480 RepID=A0ABR9XGF7_9SPHI|nr:SusC/RagA family TonB-linked outer membrane protein [Mucilaginibacter boryungensis]
MALVVSPHLASASSNFILFQQQETVTVKGVVVDDTDGSPLPGVTIADAQRKTYGLTDINGAFTVKVPKGVVIQFSFLGYTVQKQAFNNNQEKVSIRLKSTSSDLNEVQVTALGIKRETKALGYATTVIKSEQLNDAPAANWTDALSGKVAGLNLVRSNSGPTGSTKIILRGENNLTGSNEALIVVDGVVTNRSSGRRIANGGEAVYGTGSDNMPADYGSSINDINPQDIESVTVLKGPAAAALYGQDGANGAVIITTKSGNPKKKGVGISVNSNANMEQVNRWPDYQWEYGQGTAGANYYSFGASADGGSTSGTSSAYGPKFDGQMFYQFDPVTQAQGKVRTPWVPYTNKIHSFFNTGKTLTNNVSVDGGTDKTTARFNVSNVTNNWITPNTGYGRNTVSMSVNSKINDKLTIAAKVNYQNKFSDNMPGAGYGNQSLMYWFIFWQPNADIDWLKNYWKIGQTGRVIEYPYSTFPENPYAITYEFINKQNRNAVTGNVQATYNITKGLSLQLRTSLDMSYDHREQDRPYDAGTKLPKGSFRYQNIYQQETSADFLLRYTKQIRDFNITATAGGSMVKNNYREDELRADSLIYPEVYTTANSAGVLIALPNSTKFAINSFYGLLSTSYKNYLYLDITGRQDWNSTLATPERTDKVGFFYPSASLSYVASDHLKLPDYVSFAKLRFSAASVGSGSTVPYRTAFTYESAGSTYAGGLKNPSIIADPNLEPLRTVTYELGTDLRFFKSRVNLDLAVYEGNTTNQILNRVIDNSAGAPRAVVNLGTVFNKGIEITAGGTPIQKKNFKWMVNYTFSANRNKITALGDSTVVLQTGPVAQGQLVAKVGGSMGDLYGTGYQRSPDGQVVFNADPAVQAVGTALITPNPIYLGNTQPKWKMGLSNDFTYKNFHLSVLFDGQYGAVAYSLTAYKLAEQGKTTNTLPGRYNGIIGNGVIRNADGTYRPNDIIASDIDQYYQHAYGSYNAEGATYSTNFIKLREATLNYTLPARLTSKIGVQRATIGVYGRDLFIWTKWPGFDPEFGTLAGADITQGFEIGQFPSSRTLGVSVAITL